jgi:imidazolonepropionase-like amidohydrolase
MLAPKPSRRLIRNKLRLMCVNWLMRSALSFLIAYAGLVGVTHAQDIAVTNATVYTSPDAAAQLHTTVLIKSGRIVSVGNSVSVPQGVRTLPCQGCAVFAGFWNTHVHFTGPEWDDASKIPANKLTRQMQVMVTHSGFTTVVDTSSDRDNTVELRHRVEIGGDALGPRIYTGGFGLYPPHGIPYYLDDLPASLLAKLPQPDSPAAAVAVVQQNIAMGTDIVKLFVGSYHSPDDIIHMPLDIARAAVSEGHRHGQLVFAHPSDLEGFRIASPAARFKVSAHSGTIRVGNDGDLTILLTDPTAGELEDFTRVAYTIRGGQVIFDATAH